MRGSGQLEDGRIRVPVAAPSESRCAWWQKTTNRHTNTHTRDNYSIAHYTYTVLRRPCTVTTGISLHPYEGCTYCFIHEEAHTNVRFLSCDGHQLYELGVDLEVEGVRYIEMHRGPAAYVLGPPPSLPRSR